MYVALLRSDEVVVLLSLLLFSPSSSFSHFIFILLPFHQFVFFSLLFFHLILLFI